MQENLKNEDIIVVNSIPEVAQLYRKNLIWYEPNIYSAEFKPFIEQLKAKYPITTFTSYKEAADNIKAVKSSLIVIASSVDGEIFIKEISQNQKIFRIFIFGGDVGSQNNLKNLDKRVICLGSDFDGLVSRIEAHLIKNDFPVFAPIFNDMDKSHVNHLHYYLRGLIEFENRPQAEKDFVALAKETWSKQTKTSSNSLMSTNNTTKKRF